MEFRDNRAIKRRGIECPTSVARQLRCVPTRHEQIRNVFFFISFTVLNTGNSIEFNNLEHESHTVGLVAAHETPSLIFE
jgi:hypothetical protein